MAHTFGIFTKSQKGVTFGNMKASVVEGIENPNQPSNPGSPNAPRVEGRLPGYPNPLLGDKGNGSVGRWQSIKLDALAQVIDQMIEQYLRDKTWYSTVRCREALWNMYRRIEWWVKQQTDPQRSDYQRALQMIKDCIYEILKDAQTQGSSHEGVALPTCPAPYQFPYQGDYFNHFDGADVEVKVYDFGDLPKAQDFPGFFRYVSSSEEQEWKLVHSTGGNEATGTENIMKLDLADLKYGNSSKITFNWRFKKRGFVRFQYFVSAPAGNGLLFFINNNQVGGEWSGQTGWQTAKFNVQPGQTYKLDWLVRKQVGEVLGTNCVYIKDVECVEVIKTAEPPTPHDWDTLGESNEEGLWVTYSSQSLARAEFQGLIVNEKSKTMTFFLDNECDGTLQFAYKLSQAIPKTTYDYVLYYDEPSLVRSQSTTAPHGSTTGSQHDTNWQLTGDSITFADGAKITYDIVVAPGALVTLEGAVAVDCPAYVIDHYEPYILATQTALGWGYIGRPWTNVGGHFRLDDPSQGQSGVYTTVSMPDDGWFEFSYAHDLRPTESFQVVVDGNLMFQTIDVSAGTNMRIPLTSGTHTISFNVLDSYTEIDFQAPYEYKYTYGVGGGAGGVVSAPFGSKNVISRGWHTNLAGAETSSNGSTITQNITLNPHATFYVEENLRVLPEYHLPADPVTGATGDIMVFEENFNDPDGSYNSNLSFSGNWSWTDVVAGVGVDGIMKSDGQSCSASLSGVFLGNAGYITFQYGGKYGMMEYLEFQVDGVTIWQGNDTSLTVGTNIIIPLPAGNHSFKWVFENRGGTTVPEPGTGGTAPTPGTVYGEQCFPSGSGGNAIGYGSDSSHIVTPRNVILDTGHIGTVGSFGGGGLGTVEDNAILNRAVTVPNGNYVDVHYTETLKVYPTGVTTDTGLKDVKSAPTNFWLDSAYNPINVGNGFIGLHVRGTPPGTVDSSVGENTLTATRRIYTSGSLELDFDYLAYLYSGGRQVARFRVILVNEATGATITLTDVGSNAGSSNAYLVDYRSLIPATKWANAKHLHFNKRVTAGWYQIRFCMTDTYSDNDGDGTYFYHASIHNIKIKVTDPINQNPANEMIYIPATNERTWVEYRVFDGTGRQIENRRYDSPTNGTLPALYSVSFYPPDDGTYFIEYILHKGDGEGAGLAGGGYTLSGGTFAESYVEYCKDSNNTYYRKGTSPNPPVGGGGGGIIVPPSDSYPWLDVIRVYENLHAACEGTRIEVTVTRDSVVVYSETVTSSAGQLFSFASSNVTNQIEDYTITYQFFQGCAGDGAMAWGGRNTFIDTLVPKPSFAEVWGVTVTDNREVWMGGCNGSSLHVKVTNSVGTVLLDNTYSASGLSSFAVNDLSPTPYSSYKVEITTSQLGAISAWTGRDYRTKLSLVDFKTHERWTYTPEPFNSRLEVLVDGSLKRTYDTMGGYFTDSIPVEKGAHRFDWVFITDSVQGDFVYDKAEIDWIRLTNWICDSLLVVPYCEPGSGDKCVEALLRCLMHIHEDKPKACVIGETIWLFT
jgi:hypothetical protein